MGWPADTADLLRRLPPIARLAWILLLAGLTLAALGFFRHVAWQNLTGLALLLGGYLLGLLDMVLRRRRRAEAAGFYTGLVVAPIFATFLSLLAGLIAVIVVLVSSLLRGWSPEGALQTLHYLGLLFAVVTIMGIPAIARRAQPDRDAAAGSPLDADH